MNYSFARDTISDSFKAVWLPQYSAAALERWAMSQKYTCMLCNGCLGKKQSDGVLY